MNEDGGLVKQGARKRRKNHGGNGESGGKALTLKERKFVQALLEGKNRRQAALAAGYKSDSTGYSKLHPTGYGTGRGGNLRAYFMKLMEDMGLDDQSLLQVLRDGVKARCPKWNASTKRWDFFVDSGTRLEAADMGFKLRGRYPPAEDRGTLVAVHIETNLTDPEEVDDAFVVEAKANVGGGNSDQLEQQ